MLIVRVPQVGVNDEFVLVVEWLKSPGDLVKKGEHVGSIETSKAVVEVEAEADGHFRPLADADEQVAVDAPLYVLTESPDDPIDHVVAEKEKHQRARDDEVPSDRRWTKKAEMLARKHGIDIEEIPAVGLLQVADVEQYLKSASRSPAMAGDVIDGVYSMNRAERILVIGGGRGAVQVLDIIHAARSQRVIGIVDDNRSAKGKTLMGVEVLGTTDLVRDLHSDGRFDAAIIAFSNNLEARAKTFEKLASSGIPFTNVIDPSVTIHSNVSLGTGNVFIANCRIGACAQIGDNNFLSAYINIEHHNVLGSHCTFGPGVLTSSRVWIGDRVRFGTGIFIEPGVKIGSDCIVASGSILTADVPDNSIVKAKVDVVVRQRR